MNGWLHRLNLTSWPTHDLKVFVEGQLNEIINIEVRPAGFIFTNKCFLVLHNFYILFKLIDD